MKMLKPGAIYYGEFTTSNPSTGAAQNADALPVATITRNGADDGGSPTAWSNTLAVVNLATGRYKITGTIPAAYAIGDQIQISVAATVASVAGVGTVDAFTLDGFPAIAPGVAGGLPTEKHNRFLWVGDGGTNSYETLACYRLNGAVPTSLPVAGDEVIVSIYNDGLVGYPHAGTLVAGVLTTFVGKEGNYVQQSGTVGNFARFEEWSFNAGTVGDYAMFSGNSFVSDALGGGIVGNHATFRDASYITSDNSGVQIGLDAVLDTAGSFSGATFSGDVYLRKACNLVGSMVAGTTYYLYDTQTSKLKYDSHGNVLSAPQTTVKATDSNGDDLATSVGQSAIKAQTDKLKFNSDDYVKSSPQTEVVLAETQSRYAPAKAGDQMDLVSAWQEVLNAIKAIVASLTAAKNVSSDGDVVIES